MADFSAKAGDTAIVWNDTLTYSDNTPVNLTGATVNLVVRSLSQANPIINAAASIVTPLAGTVSYNPSATDTATVGEFMGNWVVTFSGGTVETFPTVGYLTVAIEQNLTAAGTQQLISVTYAKDVLNMQDVNRVHDEKILRWINACRPVIEGIAGPIIQQTFEEWHDGGHHQIVLRRRPSNTYGTTPILIVNAISEYNGPIEWPLQIVSTPDEGVLYSVLVDGFSGIIERRTSGGGVQAFPDMPQSVHVWYTAGQSAVPDNVAEATAELLRQNYQATAQALRSGRSRGGEEIPQPPMGFYVPGRVRELLAINRRAPVCM